MKLVEIASATGTGQPWTFGQETEEDSDDENDDNNSSSNNKNNNKGVCNGHGSAAAATTEVDEACGVVVVDGAVVNFQVTCCTGKPATTKSTKVSADG